MWKKCNYTILLFTEGSWLTNDLMQFAPAVVFFLLFQSQKKRQENILVQTWIMEELKGQRTKIKELHYCSGFLSVNYSITALSKERLVRLSYYLIRYLSRAALKPFLPICVCAGCYSILGIWHFNSLHSLPLIIVKCFILQGVPSFKRVSSTSQLYDEQTC